MMENLFLSNLHFILARNSVGSRYSFSVISPSMTKYLADGHLLTYPYRRYNAYCLECIREKVISFSVSINGVTPPPTVVFTSMYLILPSKLKDWMSYPAPSPSITAVWTTRSARSDLPARVRCSFSFARTRSSPPSPISFAHFSFSGLC